MWWQDILLEYIKNRTALRIDTLEHIYSKDLVADDVKMQNIIKNMVMNFEEGQDYNSEVYGL